MKKKTLPNDSCSETQLYLAYILRIFGLNLQGGIGHLNTSSNIGLYFLNITDVTLKFFSICSIFFLKSTEEPAMSIQFLILLKNRTRLLKKQ